MARMLSAHVGLVRCDALCIVASLSCGRILVMDSNCTPHGYALWSANTTAGPTCTKLS